jgi:hypothetical protein
VRAAVVVAVNVVVHVATPDPLRAWAEHPVMVVPPFLNPTVPVGVTPPPVTVAVSVVEVPTVVGLGDEVSTVVETPAETTMVKLVLVDVV